MKKRFLGSVFWADGKVCTLAGLEKKLGSGVFEPTLSELGRGGKGRDRLGREA